MDKKECPDGKIRNPKTGRCIKDPKLEKDSKVKLKECPDGKIRNPKTGRCIKDPKLEKDSKVKLKECPDGKILNPKTGRCIKDPKLKKDSKVKLKECPDGKILNPKTGRCIKDPKLEKDSKVKISSNPVNMQQLENLTCSNVMANPESLNALVIRKIRTLHDQWVQGKNMYALLEANYLIDYYCSHVLILCESSNPLEDRKIIWQGNTITYDQFKHMPKYEEGFQKVKQFINSLVFTVLDDLRLIGVVSKSHLLDWKKVVKTVHVAKILKSIKTTVKGFHKYYASGWGMYRLLNMKTFLDKAEVVEHPCSCICVSLLYITILCQMGFPREHIFTHGQTVDAKLKRKLTHWAISCRDILGTALHKLNNREKLITVFDKEIATSEGFTLYTRDIIEFYMMALKRYRVKHQDKRRLILQKLKALYDKEFSDIYDLIKTPT
jgi:hypothetical protein